MSKSHITDINGQYSLPIEKASNELLKQFTDDEIIAKAYKILEQRALNEKGKFLESPDAVKRLFQLRHSGLTHETFDVALLDNRHRLRQVTTLFTGTIDSCSVYPRRVLELCLKSSTPIAACIFSHSHPSGVPEPSRADIDITAKLKKALAHVDIRVLDHIISTNSHCVSLAERGEI